MEARSTPALPTMRLPNKKQCANFFDMTAFSWKSLKQMTLIDNIPLGIASGGSLVVARTLFSSDRRHLAIISQDSDSSWRVLTFEREQSPVAGSIWAEVGSPSRTNTFERAEILARENLMSMGGGAN